MSFVVITDVKQPERILCHSCLIYLGDLSRYRESDENGNYETAKYYYQQAMLLAPSEGRSHSQLAILASAESDYLEVIFQYVWYEMVEFFRLLI